MKPLRALGTARAKYRRELEALRHFGDPVVPAGKSLAALRAYPNFLKAWRSYERLPGAEPLHLRDGHPCLFDNLPTTPYDPHYFHQAVWATERILKTRPDIMSTLALKSTSSACSRHPCR